MELKKIFTNDIEMLELVSDFNVNSVVEKIETAFNNYKNYAGVNFNNENFLKIEDIKAITYNEDKNSVTLDLVDSFVGIKLSIDFLENYGNRAEKQEKYIIFDMCDIDTEIRDIDNKVIYLLVDIYREMNEVKKGSRLNEFRTYLINFSKEYKKIRNFRIDYNKSENRSELRIESYEGASLRVY